MLLQKDTLMSNLLPVSNSSNYAQVPDRQNEALWCHLMVGGAVWQEVLNHREEEGRLAQVLQLSK